MKKSLLFLAAIAFSFSTVLAQDTIYTSNSSQEIGDGSVACGTTGGPSSENHYYKKFDLADLGVVGTVNINNFDFGVQTVRGSEVNLSIELWKTNVNTFPATWGGNDYTMIASGSKSVTPSDDGTIVTVEFDPVAVSEGEYIIAHVFHGDLTFENFFIGSNDAPDSQPSYIMAPGCGMSIPTPLAEIEFPDMHIVMNLAYRALGVEDFTSADLTLFPNPASDQFTISSGNETIQTVIVRDILGKTIQTIQVNGLNQNVNVSNLPKGLYLVEVELETGRAVQKLIKN